MQKKLSVLVVVATCLASAAAAKDITSAAPPPAAGTTFDAVVRLLPPTSQNDHMALALLKLTGDKLLQRSSTFADMLHQLSSDVAMRLYLETSSRRGIAARTRFEVSGSRVFGQMEIGARQSSREYARVRLIAHELAHAYEVMCLLPMHTTLSLRDALAQRAATYGSKASLETPFAAEIEEATYREWVRKRSVSQLEDIGVRYGLTDCRSARLRSGSGDGK